MTALKPDFQPPHNLDAEQGLLGALLYHNEFFERFCADLLPRHFYDAVHGEIFAVIGGLIQNGRAVDGVSLRQHFMSDGALAEIGGAEYLLTLAENAARLPVHVQEYAFVVRDLAMRRAAIKDLEGARLHLFSDHKTPAQDLLLDLEKRVGAYASSGRPDEDITIRDAALGAIEKYEAGGRGISTGLGELDELIAGLFPEDLIVIAGRPAMGKTALADNIAHAAAKRGKSVAFWAGDTSAEQIAERAVSRASYGGPEPFEYRAFRRRGVPVEAARRLASDLPRSLVINRRGAISLERLAAFMRRTRRANRGLDLVVVDYLQLMSHDLAKQGMTQKITAITQGLKQLGKDFSVPVIALSQLSRDVERREDKRPQLADLRESGSIEQDADTVIFVYRERYYLEREEPRPRSGESKEDFDVRAFRWAERMEFTSGKVEIIAGKTRHDAIGAKNLHVDLGYDVVADLPNSERASVRNPAGHDA